MSNIVKINRVLKAPPERVYRALLDPDALVKWNSPFGFTAKIDFQDATVGGGYRMYFTNFSTEKRHSFSGRYLELVQNKKVHISDTFDDPNIAGEMQTTYELIEVSTGTKLYVTQEGLPEEIPPEACQLGWQESLVLLAQLVEPEIPD